MFRLRILATLSSMVSVIGVVGTAGCQRPRLIGPPHAGRVNLGALVALHPGWARVQDLDRKIAALRAGAPLTGPLFAPPPPAQLEQIDTSLTVDEAGQREQMARVIAERVKKDFDAQALRLRRQALRNERLALATSLVEVGDRIERERAQYTAQYNATAISYAHRLGPLVLQRLGLHSNPLETNFYPPDELQRRFEERRRLDRDISSLLAQEAEDLKRLLAAYEAVIQQMRTAARDEALAKVREDSIRALANLESQRRVQQAQLEADLERTLQVEPQAAPAPLRDLPVERRQVAGEAAAFNEKAAAQLAAQRAAVGAALDALTRQRGALVAVIEAATRAAATEVAAEHQLAIDFGEEGSDRKLTEWVAARLRERWAKPSASGRGSGA